jgi:hypothetical protein
MMDMLALVLVFVAVTWIVWVITPLLAQIGLERSAGRYVKVDEKQRGPIYRFTTPERLAQACWSGALLGAGVMASILIVAEAQDCQAAPDVRNETDGSDAWPS